MRPDAHKNSCFSYFSVSYTHLHTFCQEHALTVTTAFYDDDQALCSALTNGGVDALISSNIHQIENVRPVANFAFHSFYFVTNKMRKDVLVELNDGLNHLHYNNPDFEKGDVYKRQVRNRGRNSR